MADDYGFEYDDDVDVILLEEDDTDFEYEDEGFAESDDEDLAERSRRSRRSRRPRRVRPGRTGGGRQLFRPRPTGNYVTQPQLQAGLARVGSDIRKNGAAIKRVVSQVNTNNRMLSAANARQDRQISNVRKDLKKQTDMMLMLTLLQKAPELEPVTTKAAGIPEIKGENHVHSADVDVLQSVKLKEQDSMLPLLLIMGMGGGGLGGGDSSTMLLMVLALSGKL